MIPELWLAYIAASCMVLIIPGPTVLLLLTTGMAHDKRAALSAVPGVVLGDAVAMTLSLAGLGALMAASAQLFTLVKWAGALYLVYLGVRMWRSPAHTPEPQNARPDTALTGRASARRGFLVTVLNPKPIIFFTAFLPQFMNPQASYAMQAFTMGAAFLVLSGCNASLYALAGSRAAAFFHSPGRARLLGRAGGTALVGAGVYTAFRSA